MLTRLLPRLSDQNTHSKLDFLLVSALFFSSGTGKTSKERSPQRKKIKGKEKETTMMKKYQSAFITELQHHLAPARQFIVELN